MGLPGFEGGSVIMVTVLLSAIEEVELVMTVTVLPSAIEEVELVITVGMVVVLTPAPVLVVVPDTALEVVVPGTDEVVGGGNGGFPIVTMISSKPSDPAESIAVRRMP